RSRAEGPSPTRGSRYHRLHVGFSIGRGVRCWASDPAIARRRVDPTTDSANPAPEEAGHEATAPVAAYEEPGEAHLGAPDAGTATLVLAPVTTETATTDDPTD